MNKRKVNITLIMDSEAQDFLNWIEHFSNVVDSRVFPLDDHLKEDMHYNALKAVEKKAKNNKYNYLNKKRNL